MTHVVLFLLILSINLVYAGVTSNGISGLINIPDGRVTQQDFLTVSYSSNTPYNSFFTSINLLPRSQFSVGIVEVKGIDGFDNNQSYGNYKDKVFNLKFLLHRESKFLPSISLGFNDFHGTALFKSNYISMSKKIGNLDATLGYGTDRIDGVFAGLHYKLPNTSIDLLLERQTIKDDQDFYFQRTGKNKSSGNVFGLEYHWGWLDFQANHSKNDNLGFKVALNIPFSFDTFIPNYDDKKPIGGKYYLKKNIIKDWKQDLYQTLSKRGFEKIILSEDNDLLQISISHNKISKVGKAIGRAARIFLHHLPIRSKIKKLKIVYLIKDTPLITMSFNNIQELEDYLNHQTNDLESSNIFYETNNGKIDYNYKESVSDLSLGRSEDDAAYKLQITNKQGDDLSVNFFNLSSYLNDPSKFFQYEIYSTISGKKRLTKNLFLTGGIRATLYETISERDNIESNSQLPHVRSDIARYKQNHGIKLNYLLLNNYNKLSTQLFLRTSLGYYEEMFAGLGGQLLYLTKDRKWIFDVAIDRLKQRDYDGRFKFLDYETTTAIASAHYHYRPIGLRLSTRYGQFLAKDKGLRFELSRRFQNGIRTGFWYTKTNGNDITTPGSIDNPYNDKGIFMSIPLNILLTKDTKSRSNISISPWSRDVGQMVTSPDDLYWVVDKELQFDKFDTKDYVKQLRE